MMFGRQRHSDALEGRPGHAPAPGLRAARTAAGMSVEDLARATGYPPDYLQRLEAGEAQAHRLITSRISAVLGTTTDAVRGNQAGQITRAADVLPEERR